MKLSSILEGVSYKCVQGTIHKEIQGVSYDSRKVEQDSVFICIEGAQVDGHQYAQEVVDGGATVLIVSKEVTVETEVDLTILLVPDTRYALACLSAAYFGHPARELKVIGITGTKGKTTTTYLVKSILEKAGYKVGLIGTIETIIGDTVIPSLNTTPESYVLQQYFRQMVDASCDIVVMEVSSQGLMLHRTAGFTFELGVFTNIQPDHIGEHEHSTYEDYRTCKSLLFQQCKVGLLNCDDPEYKHMLAHHTCHVETFGFAKEADLCAQDMQLLRENGMLGVGFSVTGKQPMDVVVATPGTFSVYNALAAISICRYFQVSDETIQKALLEVHVKGRIEVIPISNEYTLMIDYAHNAMALESLLTTLQAYHPHRLICLFGCGGNRAKSRRYEMGEVAGRLADLTIITSDNPRYEDPVAIIEDIKVGIGKTSGAYVEIVTRKEAIRYAIVNAQAGDIIVLAGKGHEDYQEIEGVKYPLDERVLIQEIITEIGEIE